MATFGTYVASAILSGSMFFTNMLPVEVKTNTPSVVPFDQLSYCTTIDKEMVGMCVGLYKSKFVLSDGSLLRPIKFPASRYAFVRDDALRLVFVNK